MAEGAAASRASLIAQLERRLRRHGLPRFEMAVIVAGTGLAGFGVSAALLAAGVGFMPLRYLVALVVTLAAAGIEWAVPDADSIGDAFRPR
jgi:hypothetical protein